MVLYTAYYAYPTYSSSTKQMSTTLTISRDTPTIIPKKAFPCPHCNKMYRRKREQELHVGMCELFNQTKTEREARLEAEQDGFTTRQLYDMVKVLVREQTKMKKEVQQLRQTINGLRKKVSVEEFLEALPRPSLSIDQWADENLKYTEDDFACFQDTRFEKSLEEIILRQTPDLKNVPFRAFCQNGGSVYGFDGSRWRKMDDEDWRKPVGVISASLLGHLHSISETNADRLAEDGFSVRYNSSIQKVMNCMPKIQSRLVALLVQRVKMSLNNVTTLEYTFS